MIEEKKFELSFYFRSDPDPELDPDTDINDTDPQVQHCKEGITIYKYNLMVLKVIEQTSKKKVTSF